MALYWQLPIGKVVSQSEAQSIIRELSKKKRQKKILKRQPTYEPPKIKKQKIHQQYRSTSARDHRYSDQRKLRRMYRNS